ncbi:MAG: Asp23/Gls24 family envelope stress response protein, partial [Ruminococcus sp.]|nr:Asp23/Gls24 family envelope stress response protein [Ruminococcus sp.]
MIKVSNHLGTIKISNKYLRDIISNTVESCFGVAGMNCYGAVQGAACVFLGKKNLSNKGVIIKQNNNQLAIDLHITVTYGINVTAVTNSIIHKVQFVLNDRTGIE